MKNVIKFLLFIAYSTCIFFLPNNSLIILLFLLNIFIMFLSKVQIKRVLAKSIQILPFIIFTFIINCLLDDVMNAVWIGVKLFIVCNITIIYSETTSINRYSRDYKNIMLSTKNF